LCHRPSPGATLSPTPACPGSVTIRAPLKQRGCILNPTQAWPILPEMLHSNQDAYGQIIYAHHKGLPSVEIIERDDHWFGCSTGAPAYFASFERWPSVERRAMRQIRGRVLDIGCGAGRLALDLQARGHDVVAIDISPLAVKTCLLRGVRDARICSITRVSRRLGHFDTIVMFGNNFGLFGNAHRARWLLRRFHSLTSPTARIVAESRDPYKTITADHRRYHELNRRRGRLAGQLRLRVRFGQARTPWFDYLIVSPREMRKIVEGTGWHVARLIRPVQSMSRYWRKRASDTYIRCAEPC
jgi:SAM-dependent methyltransferase